MTRSSRTRPSRGRRARVTTLPQLLSTAVEADPDAIAVVLADAETTLAELTYAELDERSTRVARLLIGRGIGPEDLVAVVVPRSLEAVIAVWAVAKCGAGFVPVDPDAPAQRIARIVADSGAVLGLTVAAARPGLPAAANWLAIDTAEFAMELEEFAADPVTYADRLRPLRAEHPAYAVYTAEDAVPGIVVTQAGLSGLCDEQRIRYHVDGDARTLAFAAPADHAFVLELLLAIGGTAAMVVAAPTVHEGAELAALLLREDVTHAYLAHGVLESVDPAGLDELRVVICGGLPAPELAQRWAGPVSPGPFGAADRQVLHGYGAAETTVMTHVGPLGEPSVGTPVRGIAEYVLDERLSPVAEGDVGELYIAGAQLARGYRRRPVRTALRFVANPFAAPGGLPGENDMRLFRTGDLVRRTAEGTLEYVGPAGVVDEARDDAAKAEAPDDGPSWLVGRHDTVDEIGVRAVDAAKAELGDTAGVAVAAMSEAPRADEAGAHTDAGGRSVTSERAGAGAAPDVREVSAESGAGLDALEGADAAHRIPLGPMTRPSTTVEFEDTVLPSVPLSLAQQSMWEINRGDPESLAHNVCFAVRIGGHVRVEALQVAVVDVIERHQMLRTVYPAVGDTGSQAVLPLDQVLADLTPAELTESEIEGWLADYARIAFDVTVEVPVQIGIAAVAPDDHVVAVVAHRIAADEASITPFLRDLAVALLARRNRATPRWAPLPLQYADFALWQRTVLGDETDPESAAAREIEYWRTTMAGVAELRLPVDRQRPQIPRSGRGAEYSFTVAAGVHAGLEELVTGTGATLFTAVHAGFAALLARLSGNGDIVVGSRVAGRGIRELDGTIGLFENTVALRTRVDAAASFADLLAGVRRSDLEAFAHAELPFARVARALPVGEVAPWPRAALVVRAADQPQLALPGLSATGVEVAGTDRPCELRLAVVPRRDGDAPGGLSATFTYDTELFDEITIAGFAERLVHLLTAGVADPRRPIGDIDLLQPDERVRILTAWNNTRYSVEPGLLLDGYRQAVQQVPDAVAISCGDAKLTYAQFDSRVNQLARLLISRGVGPETAVALAIRPSTELLVGMYAILTAGGAFVPVDPDDPIERIAHILDVARPACVVTTVADTVPAPVDTQVLRLDTMDLGRFDPSPVRPDELTGSLLPGHPAYFMFAGDGHGAVVSHAAIDHQLEWMLAAYPLDSTDVYLHRSAATRARSPWGYFLPLRVGATLRLAPPEGRLDPLYLAETIAAQGVTVTDFAPSELALFAGRTAPGICPTLREIFVIGEALTGQTVAALQRICDARVHHLYGPAGVAVSVMYWPADGADRSNVPIGLPQWNTQVYVLDDRLRPVPVGVPGELFLGGAQLARGFAGRPPATADRFVANPFADGDAAGSRLYRTGDLVVWREGAGELPARLDYLGRTDPTAEESTEGSVSAASLVDALRPHTDRPIDAEDESAPEQSPQHRIDPVSPGIGDPLPHSERRAEPGYRADAERSSEGTEIPDPATISESEAGTSDQLPERMTGLESASPHESTPAWLQGHERPREWALDRESRNTATDSMSWSAGSELAERALESAVESEAQADAASPGESRLRESFEESPASAEAVAPERTPDSPEDSRTEADALPYREPLESLVELRADGEGTPSWAKRPDYPVAESEFGAEAVPPWAMRSHGSVEESESGWDAGPSWQARSGESAVPSWDRSSYGPLEDLDSPADAAPQQESASSGPTEEPSMPSRRESVTSSEPLAEPQARSEAGSAWRARTLGSGVKSEASRAKTAWRADPARESNVRGRELLSPAQERMWTLNRADQVVGARVPAAYHLPFVLRLTGSLDVESLSAALDDVINRHDVLRTVYPAVWEGGAGVSRPGRTVMAAQARPENPAAQRITANEVLAAVWELAAAPFDVTTEAPLRVRLFEISDLAPGSRREYVLAVVVHHIAADTTSLEPLISDLMAAYAARTAGHAPRWEPLPAQYADYLLRHEELLGAEWDHESVAAQQISYWRRQLSGLPAELPLPVDRMRPDVATLAGARTGLYIEAAVHAALLTLADRSGATLFTVVHAALATLLGRLTGSDDIPLGTPVSGRGEGEFDDLIGTFVNTVVLRARLNAAEPFTDLLIRQREMEAEAFAHSDIPFARLVRALDAERSTAHHPLFQVGVSVRSRPRLAVELPGLTVDDVDTDLEVSHFDLNLALTETHDPNGIPTGIDGELTYATDLFAGSTAEAIAIDLVELLTAIADNPAISVGGNDIDAQYEEAQYAEHDSNSDAPWWSVESGQESREWSDAPVDSWEDGHASGESVAAAFEAGHSDRAEYEVDSGESSEPSEPETAWRSADASPDGPTLASLLDHVASAEPDAVAIVAELPQDEGGTAEFTLGDLDARANRLARYLISLGVGPDSLVVLALPRSVDLGVAVYAVAKAGGAAVPIDPDGSVERGHEILAAAEPVCVLTDSDHPFAELDRAGSGADAPTRLLVPIGRRPVHTSQGQPTVIRVDELNLEGVPTHRLTDDDRIAPLHAQHPAWVVFPSGTERVVVSHAGALGQLHGDTAEFGLDGAQAALLRSASAFDVSVWDFWTAVAGEQMELAAEAARPRTLPDLMAAAVAANANSPAVVARGRSFSYAQLDVASSKLARRLIELGAGPQVPVAVAIPRSLEALVTVWSVAKTGAAVVPVEPFLPHERIGDLVADSGAALGVTVRGVSAGLPRIGHEWVVLDDPNFAAQVDSRSGAPITDAERVTALHPDDGAYVLYGAGDADHQQGAVVAHGDLARLSGQAEHYRLHHDSRILALAAPSSDEAVLELLLALGAAATLVVVPAAVDGGPELARLIGAERVTHAFLPGSVMRSMDPSALAGLEVIVTDTTETDDAHDAEEPAESAAPVEPSYPVEAAAAVVPEPVPARAQTPAERIIAEAREQASAAGLDIAAAPSAVWQLTQSEDLRDHVSLPVTGDREAYESKSADGVSAPPESDGNASSSTGLAGGASRTDPAEFADSPTRESIRTNSVGDVLSSGVGDRGVPQVDPAEPAQSHSGTGGEISSPADPIEAAELVSGTGDSDDATVRPTPPRAGEEPDKAGRLPHNGSEHSDRADARPAGVLPLSPRAIRVLDIDPSGREIRALSLDVPEDCPAEGVLTAAQGLLDRHPLLSARLAVATGSGPNALRTWAPAFARGTRDARLVLDDAAPRASVRQFVRAEGVAGVALRALTAELDPAHGRNIRFGLIADPETDVAQGSVATVVIVANGLVVDDSSWRIIIDELCAAWSGRGAPFGTPSTPDGVARGLAERATDASATGEMFWWRRTLAGLPAETPLDGADLITRGRVSLTLTTEGAAAVDAVAAAYHAEVQDVLLAALALVPRSRGTDALGAVVQLPADGRSIGGPESVRVVGGFTAAYPLPLNVDDIDIDDALAGGPAAGTIISRVKEQRRAVPAGGIGYGPLRYLNPATADELAALPNGRTAFRYRDLRPARAYPDTPPADLFLDITVDATEDGLRARFDYASAVLEADEVKELAGHWVRALGGLAEHGTRPDAGGFTPSDFPLVPLAQSDIDRLLLAQPELADLWPITPPQTDLIAPPSDSPTPQDDSSSDGHSAAVLQLPQRRAGQRESDSETPLPQLPQRRGGTRTPPSDSVKPRAELPRRRPESSVAQEDSASDLRTRIGESSATQFAVDLNGPLDDRRMRLAAQAVLDRHDGLRVVFATAEGDPVQLVLESVDVAWRTLDFTDMGEVGARTEVVRYEAADRLAPFDPERAPLLRFALLRSAREVHRMLVTAHPLLLDDRSLRLVMRDLLTAYARGPRSRQLPAVYPYRAYPAWLAMRDLHAARTAWYAALSGYDEPVMLARSAPEREISSATARVDLDLGAGDIARLSELAARPGISVRTVVQAAWGLLIGRTADRDDVVFGLAVPGRPAAVPDSDAMVGRFGGVVPARVCPEAGETVTELLRRLGSEQDQLLGQRCPALREIRESLGMEQLFDSVVVFADAADRVELTGILDGIAVAEVDGEADAISAFGYPITVAVALNGAVHISLRYRCGAISEPVANYLAYGLSALIRQIAEAPQARVADLDTRIDAMPADAPAAR
ncbi:AMP-binding protein [Nocardia sp. NEAU-G5]|uniref:AMP-binding protein n=1 Tax=Nocardia albiluteola TaxID=2842303 RepID=A0ABS6BC43_9NOCA|nr:condensation domain-containing protein [Nocardia albiluteola]MBU3067350.1 AMP-binding protein [Nocardia albiluteola]